MPDAIVMTIFELAIDKAEDYLALVFVSKRTHSLLRSTGGQDHLKNRLHEGIRRAQQALDDHQHSEDVQLVRRAPYLFVPYIHIFATVNMPFAP